MSDTFFNMEIDDWLKPNTLPTLPLKRYSNVFFNIPIIYGDKDYSEFNASKDCMPIDIFGSAFYMLTRYEEVVLKDKDKFCRFPVKASLAYRENFLDRPIINEYIEILWSLLKKIAPDIKRKNRKFKICPSHDIDHPFQYGGMGLGRFLKHEIGTIQREGLKTAYGKYHMWKTIRKYPDKDPFFTFSRIMDISEENNLNSCFYFMVNKEKYPIEIFTDLNDSRVCSILPIINQRGHDIGLHVSFSSSRSEEKIREEFDILKFLCRRYDISQEKWGCRYHFLNVNFSDTFSFCENSEIDYDTSVMHPEVCGFRSGICYEYPLYDLIYRKRLNIKEKPLIVMDGTIMNTEYMNLGFGKKAFDYIMKLKNWCRKYNGDFNILS